MQKICTHWWSHNSISASDDNHRIMRNGHRTFACSRNDSTIRRSTRDGLMGSGGTGMLLALETILPGFWRANSASVCHKNNPQNFTTTVKHHYFINIKQNYRLSSVVGVSSSFIQCEVVGTLRSHWMAFSHVIQGRPGRLFQFSGGRAVRIISASASSSIRAMCLNTERCCDWTIAVRLGCLVILLTSLLQTSWYHLISSSVFRHHWSRASILQWLPSIQIRIERLVGYKSYTTSALLG